MLDMIKLFSFLWYQDSCITLTGLYALKNIKINFSSEIKSMLFIEEAYSSHCMYEFIYFLYLLMFLNKLVD